MLKTKTEEAHNEDFEQEVTPVWSFLDRGAWATHSPDYRGNWSPYIPHNLILKYPKPGDVVFRKSLTFNNNGQTAPVIPLIFLN